MTSHDTEKPGGEDRDFASLDKAAKANLDVVFHMMPNNVINKPNINNVDQDEFINLWMESELDLFTIRDNQTKRGIEAAVDKLHKQPLPPSLKQVIDFEAKDILYLRQQGRISEDNYDKYGPSLILQYVLAMERLSKSIFTGRSSIKETQDKFVAYEMAKRKQGRLENVDWSPDLVSSLLSAVDPQLPHPDVIKKLRRPDAKRVPWMDVGSFFKILRSGFEKMKEEEELIFSMGRTSLLSASEALNQKQGDILEGVNSASF